MNEGKDEDRMRSRIKEGGSDAFQVESFICCQALVVLRGRKTNANANSGLIRHLNSNDFKITSYY